MSRRSRKGKSVDGAKALQVVHPHAAGIDLGSREHWVCCPSPSGDGCEVRGFGCDTLSLRELVSWLRGREAESVAMESTGVYWIPVFETLAEAGFDVILVDARAVAKVPGRKTDVLDCQWLQQLHACGLLRGAFRPGEDAVRFRALERMRGTLVSEASDWLRRIQKELDQMNVRVHRAVADITGTTGMAILHAIVDGERDPAKLAALRDPRCRMTREQIGRELSGNWREEHLLNLDTALAMYEFCRARVDQVTGQIAALLESYRVRDGVESVPAPPPSSPAKAGNLRRRGQEEMRQTLFAFAGIDLTRIDGIGVDTARTLLSEIGPGVIAFATEKQFVAYLQLSPGLGISGGKPVRNRKKPRVGNNRARQALLTAALAAGRTKTALGAYHRSLAVRKGAGVAAFAVARKLAQYVYRMLRFGTDYVDHGLEEYEEQVRQRRMQRLQHNARELGFTLTPAPEGSAS